MKIIVIGATGTIGSEVAKALTQNQRELVRASRKSEVKVNLDDPTSVRSLFDQFRMLTRSSAAPETPRSSLLPN
jgi:uncharacterized protein YbjT (DUF2867 family)